MTEIALGKPAFRGLGYLVDQFSGYIKVPVHRDSIDWRKTAYEGFGWSTIAPNGDSHSKQEQVMDAIFTEKKKVIVVEASKRGGKTQTAIAAAKVMHKIKPDTRGWCLSKTYDLSDRVFEPLWRDLATGNFGDIQDKSRKDRRLRMATGGLAQGKSWDDPDSLEGESLDYAICDEAQTLDELRFSLIMARTTDRDGFMLLIGSPGANDLYFLQLCEEAKINPDWEYVSWTIYENPFQSKQAIERIQLSMPADSFREFYMLERRMPEGLVFKDEYDPVNSTFTHEPNPELPMDVWIDPGTTSSAYAVAFVQVIPGAILDVKVYDELYMHNTYSEKVIQKTMQHVYWPMVTRGVIDIAARAHHDRADSAKDLWQALAKIPMYDQPVGEALGIERHKSFLLQPITGLRRLKHHTRCKMLRAEYLNWRYPRTAPSGNEPRKPLNAWNHLLKAITYGLVNLAGYYDKVRGAKRPSRFID